ncbi:MAG TPA: class I SAM-dependent methyltransferase [Kiritimatiellia bacterium]|nr:class I SAM-dependent methyltransferase [Kiritimatiellia bacterium]
MNAMAQNLLSVLYKASIPFVLNRGEIIGILNARGLVGEGAEVGVKCGQFSEYILSRWKGRRLYSIDPWREFDTSLYHDEDNVSQREHEQNYGITSRRLAKFGDRSVLLRLTSDEAAREIPDGSLDFVYLDARHDYASVVEDIGLWYPKVKPGGVLAGHDYMEQEKIGDTMFGVKRAVDEFVAREHIARLWVTVREPVYKSWMVFKKI